MAGWSPVTEENVQNTWKRVEENKAPTPQEIAKSQPGVGGYLLETGLNVLPSAGNLIVETVKLPFTVGKGLYEASTWDPTNLEQNIPDYRNFGRNVQGYFGERYRPSNILETIKNDPSGVAADISTLATGSGAGLRALGRAGTGARAGEALRGGARLTDPIQGISAAANASFPGARQRAAEWLYGRTIKRVPEEFYRGPGADFPTIQDARKGLAKEGIASQVPRSEGGITRAIDLQNQLMEEVNGLVSELDSLGVKVDQSDVLNSLARSHSAFGHVDPQADRIAIRGVARDFINEYGKPSFREIEIPSSVKQQDIPEYIRREGPRNPEYWWMDIDETNQIYPGNALPAADLHGLGRPTGVELNEPKLLSSGRELPPGSGPQRQIPGTTSGPVQLFDDKGNLKVRLFEGMVPGEMSPSAAHEVKKKTYKKVKDAAYKGEQKESRTEARKDLAHGLKVGIENLEKGNLGTDKIRLLNERYGRLEELINQIQNAPKPDVEGAASLGTMGLGWGARHRLTQAVPWAESQAAISIAPGPVRPAVRRILKTITPAATTNKALNYSTKDKYQIEVIGAK